MNIFIYIDLYMQTYILNICYINTYIHYLHISFGSKASLSNTYTY